MIHTLYFAICMAAVSSPAGSLTWQTNYGKALEATRHDDRPLLVVMEDTSDPHATLDPEQTDVQSDQAELLDGYQLCHVDASTDYGKQVAKAFGVSKFPYTAVIDRTGSKVICRRSGQISNDAWEALLAKYQDGETSSAAPRTSFFRGGDSQSSYSALSAPADCPACQRNVLQ